MPKLSLKVRFYAYLQQVNERNGERWVSRDTLVSLARSKSYTGREISEALYGLKDVPEIGRKTFNGEVHYKYYVMPVRLKHQVERALKWFEQLPD